jgi:hypothetical protein
VQNSQKQVRYVSLDWPSGIAVELGVPDAQLIQTIAASLLVAFALFGG